MTGHHGAARRAGDTSTGDAAVRAAGGLPVQLLPATAAFKRDLGRGRTPGSLPPLGRETAQSFERPCAQLDADARLLLAGALGFRTDRIPRDRLVALLSERCGWSADRAPLALQACLDLFVLDGAETLRLHGLWARFIGARLSELNAVAMQTVRRALHDERLDAVAAYLEALGDAQRKVRLLALDAEAIGAAAAVDEPSAISKRIGEALLEAGQFAAARPWCERAVAEKERGDIHGRVDHESLAVSRVALAAAKRGGGRR